MNFEASRTRIETEPQALLASPRPIPIFRAQTTAGTVVSALGGQDYRIDMAIAANMTGAADYVTAHIVPDGDTASAANMVMFERVVPANGVVELFRHDLPGLLPPGSSLVALCGANNAVHIWGHGVDYQGSYG